MSRTLEVTALAALWVALGGWIGALVLFAAVVAPAAFRVLPTAELAGDLVGEVLSALHFYGIAAGIGLSALARALGRPRSLVVLPLALAGLCLLSNFGVDAALARTRDLALGDVPEPSARARFALLHVASVALFAATALGAVVLAVLHARAQAREQESARSP